MESPQLSRTGEKLSPSASLTPLPAPDPARRLRELAAENGALAALAETLKSRAAQLEADVAVRAQSLNEMRAALEDSAAERQRLVDRAAEAARVLDTVRQQFRDATSERESLRAEWAALQQTSAWKLTALIRGVQRFFTRQKRSLAKRRRDAAHRILRWATAWHPTKNLRELHRSAALVRASSLIDAAWYRVKYADRVGGKTDLVLHFLRHGVEQGCDPNPFFDTRWYLDTNPDAADVNPLVHYLTTGWKEGRDPSPLFSIENYLRENPEVDAAGSEPLADYLARRRSNPSTPAPNGRHPAAPDLAPHAPAVPPSLLCEKAMPLPFHGAAVKLIAFYRPQFHPIPENDRWCGEGFTDWRDVTKGQPMFPGHDQPLLPGALGFYDLRIREVMQQQIALAREFGIRGFCFHHYWFGGKRLLERPVEQFLADAELDMPFCLCWANERWTRRGKEPGEVLIEQCHSPADDLAFIADALRCFRDPRYIRVGEKPVLVISRPDLLPTPAATAGRWRAHCREHGIELFLVAAQTSEDLDPRPLGFDAAVQFPPHNVACSAISKPDVAPGFRGKIHDYESAARSFLRPHRPDAGFPLFRCVSPGWDDTARRGLDATIFADSTPDKYARWLEGACVDAFCNHPPERRIVFVNAWNEWAGGACLEPDSRHGYACLNRTAEVLARLPAVTAGARPRLCFIACDADRDDAKTALLHLVAWLKANTNLDFRVVVLGGDSLASRFSEVAPVLVRENAGGDAKAFAAEMLSFCDQRIDLVHASHALPADLRESLAAAGVPIVADMQTQDAPKFVGAIRSVLAAEKRARFSQAQSTLSVSVVVPSYNYARYLDQRLASIEAQTFSIHEIIVLDDASQDESVEVVRRRMRESDTPMMLVPNAENSGSVSAQWSKGLELASGDLVWIAEADDYCEASFLARLASAFRDPEVVLAYSQSLPVDADGKVLRQGFGRASKVDAARVASPGLIYTDTLDSRRWEADYITTGEEEIAVALSQQNTIPNASAVLLRRTAAVKAVPTALEFKNCGDWAFYLELARQGKIAYVRANLNYFRRHEASTTVSQYARIIAEGLAIKRRLIDEGRLAGNALLESVCRSFVEYEGESRNVPDRVPLDQHPKCAAEFSRLKQSLDRVLPAGERPALLIILPDAETGGAQAAAVRLANNLARAHRVFLLSARPDLDDGNVKRMIDPRVLLFEGRLDSKIHRRFCGPPRPGWAADANPLRVAPLANLMRLMGIETVISNGWWADRLAFELTNLAPTAWFIHMHGCHESFLERQETDPEFRALTPEMMRRVAGVFHLHPKNLEVFHELKIPQPPAHRITYLAPSPAPAAPPFARKDGDFVFCLCARAIAEKGWEEAIRATLAINQLPAAARGDRRARLALIGDGPYLAELLARFPDREQIIPLGLHANPADAMTFCDAGLMPTRLIGESFPNSVVEYLASGLAVIATDQASISEMIADGELSAGLTIPLGSTDEITRALTDAMLQLMANPDRCATFRTSARALFERHFDHRACIDRVEGKLLSTLETARDD